MKHTKLMLLIGCLIFVLTGCWDEKEIGQVNYVTTLAIDYKDENYLLYVQLLDFSNVAKQETGKPSAAVPLYIGKGKGRNIDAAIYDLYRTSQQSINWAHIGAIIYSEAVLKKGLHEIGQALRKNGEFRYTPWMFGTKDPIEEVLSVTGFFQMPPIYTILYKPTDTYYIYSYIRPLRMHNFSALLSEPGSTVLLPSIAIDDSKWTEAKVKPNPKETLKIDGVFPLYDRKLKVWLPYEELSGIRWMDAKTKNTPVNLIKDGKIKGTVRITNPSAKIKVLKEADNFQFNFHVKAEGTLTSLEEYLSGSQIKKIVMNQIEKEIRDTYLNGLEKDIDVYNLKNTIFHERVKPNELDNYKLTADSMQDVIVEFQLESRGVYE